MVGSVRKLPPFTTDVQIIFKAITGSSGHAFWGDSLWDQPYSTTLNWLRCTLSFCLLRSSIQCIRDARSSISRFAKAVSPVDLHGNCGDELSVLLNFHPVISPFLLHCTAPSNSLDILFFMYNIFCTVIQRRPFTLHRLL